MTPVADPPPVLAAAPVPKPPEMVVVSLDAHSEVLATADTPLPLVKAGRSEDAVLRQAIFLASSLTVVRPAAGEGAQTLRWTYEPRLQRQLCFTSITGLFSCAAAEVEDLPETANGEAPLPPTPEGSASGPNPIAEAARTAVATTLRARSDMLFEDDRRLRLDPMLKAAGVSVRRLAPSKRPSRR